MDGDIPDDFFDELVDTEYIDKLVGSAHRDVSNRDASAIDGPNESGSGGDSPQLARCLAEIDELQRKIQRRKRKLERDLTAHRPDPLDSDPENRERAGREHLSRDRERERRRDRRSKSMSPSHRSRATGDGFRRRSRSPIRGAKHHNRHRNRSRSRSPRGHQRGGRGGDGNRNNSPGVKRESSNHKSLSFLEELAQTFAERGQDFPERDALLMHPHGGQMHGGIDTNAMQNMNIYYPGLQQQYQNQSAAAAGFPNPVGYYGINPMAMHSEQQFAMPPAMQNVNNLHEIPPNFGACAFLDDSLERSAEAEILGKELNSGLGPVENTMEAISIRCANAIKCLRAEENKVPKLKFIFTRTSSCRTEDSEIPSPLESRLNPTFRLNSAKQSTPQLSDGMKLLPRHTKVLAQNLGVNSGYIFAKLRAKEIANEIDVEVNKKDTVNADVQTDPFVCDACEIRDRRTYMSRGTQIFEKTKNTMAVQTDAEEFPLAQMMSRLTPTQLSAIRNFASILMMPQPLNPAEMFKVREKIMDAYNLAHRNGRGIGEPGIADAAYRGDGSGSSYSDHGRARDMDQRFSANNSFPFNANNRNMDDFDRGNGAGPRRPADFDIRAGPMDEDYRHDDRFRGPQFSTDPRRDMDFMDERRINEERERERLRFLAVEDERQRLLEERQMEEEHLRQQELIHREDMELVRLRQMSEEAERFEQDRRFEQDLMDFNRDSPERQGIGRPNAPFNNTQWTRGDSSRRSRGAWKSRGRGRGR